MAEPVRVRIVQRFSQPAPQAYAWLTDIQDEDVDHAGAVIKARKVRERAPGRILYEGETEVLGRRTWGLTSVTMAPPDKWEARVVEGPRTGSFTTYDLRPVPDGCELTIDYRFVFDQKKTERLARLLKPLLRMSLKRMWVGYAASMDREARATPPRAQ